MASYAVNPAGVAHCRELVADKQYVLESDWNQVQPKADDQNAFLEEHGWEEYEGWHLGLTDGANEQTKARFAFGYGDLRKVHRSGLIACVYRAAEWRHKDVERAAYDLLQVLDEEAGITGATASEPRPADAPTTWPKGLGAPATRALEGAGYTSPTDLRGVDLDSLLDLHGVGPKAVRLLRATSR